MAVPTEIKTPRLLLSPPTLADAPHLIRYANDPLVYAMTLTLPFPYTEEAAISFLYKAQSGRKDGSAQMFAIRTHENGKFMGGIGLHHNARYGWAEIGYWMGEPHRGKGYVTEAVKAVITYGFEHFALIRIQAQIREGNTASQKILIRCGLTEEATLEDNTIKGDEIHTVIQYRLLRREWEALS